MGVRLAHRRVREVRCLVAEARRKAGTLDTSTPSRATSRSLPSPMCWKRGRMLRGPSSQVSRSATSAWSRFQSM